jgi:hypothetical protein
MSAFGDTWLPRVAMPDDLVVIYVSTHGTPATRDPGKKNYIVAWDTDRDQLFYEIIAKNLTDALNGMMTPEQAAAKMNAEANAMVDSKASK